MIRFFGRARPRDPQAGVRFRPWMLVHGGTLVELDPHRIARREEGHSGLRSWTLLMAGLMTAFLLGNSWSASSRSVAVAAADACLATAPEPAAAPSER